MTQHSPLKLPAGKEEQKCAFVFFSPHLDFVEYVQQTLIYPNLRHLHYIEYYTNPQ